MFLPFAFYPYPTLPCPTIVVTLGLCSGYITVYTPILRWPTSAYVVSLFHCVYWCRHPVTRFVLGRAHGISRATAGGREDHG